jgi:carbon storage regulator CsrA
MNRARFSVACPTLAERTFMLSIFLSKNEGVVIDADITVAILGVSGDTVRLGIEHPRGVPVELGEVYAKLVQAADKPEFSS